MNSTSPNIGKSLVPPGINSPNTSSHVQFSNLPSGVVRIDNAAHGFIQDGTLITAAHVNLRAGEFYYSEQKKNFSIQNSSKLSRVEVGDVAFLRDNIAELKIWLEKEIQKNYPEDLPSLIAEIKQRNNKIATTVQTTLVNCPKGNETKYFSENLIPFTQVLWPLDDQTYNPNSSIKIQHSLWASVSKNDCKIASNNEGTSGSVGFGKIGDKNLLTIHSGQPLGQTQFLLPRHHTGIFRPAPGYIDPVNTWVKKMNLPLLGGTYTEQSFKEVINIENPTLVRTTPITKKLLREALAKVNEQIRIHSSKQLSKNAKNDSYK